MILQPGFFDHWKTRQLVIATGRLDSPLWVLRLWGFCQTGRKHRFKNMAVESLKAICAVPAEISADKWGHILTDCRFIDLDDFDGALISFTVHEWKQQNAGLLAVRENGLKGGRPRKNQQAAKAKPADNLLVPTSPPPANLLGGGLDGIGLERIGVDEIYAAYPRHIARADAFKAIEKALKKIEPVKLLERVTAYAAAVALWPASEQGFAPYPASWFNAEQWADDPVAWPRPSPVRPQKNDAAETGPRTVEPVVAGPEGGA